MVKKVAFIGKLPKKREKQKYCKCKGSLILLNFEKGEGTCPNCHLVKKPKSNRIKNLLKAGTKSWKDNKKEFSDLELQAIKDGVFTKEQLRFIKKYKIRC